MRAMTWWDHTTESIWSQPWGTSIDGPMRGTALTLIPASVVPWKTWLEEHPDTTVVADDLDRNRLRIAESRDDFVIGVAIQEFATAYYYEEASDLRVINDKISEHPVVVFVDPASRDIKVYLRRAATNDNESETPVLTFEMNDKGQVVDVETSSLWNPSGGVAFEGELKGAILQQIPYVTSFDWAWEDFFPNTTFYGRE